MKLCCSYLKVYSTKSPLCSPHVPHISNHVPTMIQSTLLLFHTRRSQCLTMKKQVLKSFFPFSAIASSVSDNSVNIYFVEIFEQYDKCSFYFHLATNLYNHPTIFSPFSNIHPTQIILRTTLVTPKILTIHSKNPFIPLINGPINWKTW